jgi:hypothetical protein
VDESLWLAAVDPAPMLEFLSRRVSTRKQRLFACACVRRHWTAIRLPQQRRAVERAEAYADRLARWAELEELAEEIMRSILGDPPFFEAPLYDASTYTMGRDIRATSLAALASLQQFAYRMAVYGGLPGTDETLEARAGADDERRAQTVVLREIVGNPFRPIVVDLLWLGWNDRCVPKLARRIYDDRSWEQMPILADALEDAGCREPVVIEHCRITEGHFRGCWVLDLLLGRR